MGGHGLARWFAIVLTIHCSCGWLGGDACAQEETAPPATVAPARTGIHGAVRTPDGKSPIAGAVVVLSNTTFAAVSSDDGTFAIDDVPAGAYELRISSPGYDDAVVPVTVGDGILALTASLQRPVTGQEIVVTGSKFAEKRLDAPVTLERLTSEDIQLTGNSSYLTALSQVKGVQYRESGLGDIRLSMRGFDSQFNTRMLFMVDGRLTEMPGTGTPMGAALPTPSLDIGSVEVVVGPASALYGANAVDGVINVITKTPWDESGVTASLRVGNQDLADASLRVAGTIKRNFGYKLNAQWMQAQDFEPDRNLPFHYYGNMAKGPLLFEGDLVANHYQTRVGKIEGFLYGRLGRGWDLKVGAGFSYSDGMSTTNVGRNELRGWTVNYQTAQLSHRNWFAQFTRTASNGGQSYAVDGLAAAVQAAGGLANVTPAALEAMRQQLRYRDDSQMLDSELQYHNAFWNRLRFTTGAQFQAYLPSSGGTYLDDANGKHIRVFLGGEYLQLDALVIRDRLRLVGAVRVDEHSDYGVQVSPKGAVVVTLAPGHNLRVGYNRAFKSPTILDAYLDIASAAAYGNHTGFVVKDANGNVVSQIAALEPESNDTLELGYKGDVRRRVFLDVVGFYSFYANFISPLSVVAYPQKGTFASLPDGTPTWQGTPLEGALLTYTNFGAAQVVGANAGVDWWILPDRLQLTASAAYIHLVSFTAPPTQQSLPLNVPDVTARAALTVQDLGLRHSFLRLQARFQNSYLFQSGFWDSTKFFPDGRLPARFVADVALGYHFASGVTLSANIFNLLDDHGIDVLGAPPGGILGYVQLSYRYAGLDY